MAKKDADHQSRIPAPKSALLVVDVQNDFCSGGALAVPGSERIFGPLNHAIEQFHLSGRPIYASRDWHPAHSVHFVKFGGRWPVHCVAGTRGANFHPHLKLPPNAVVVSKGQSGADDGYSAFDGTLPDGSRLADALHRAGIEHLCVAGLATDYCVRASSLDALKEGFTVAVLSDAIAGIDAASSGRALDEMREKGARVAASREEL